MPLTLVTGPANAEKARVVLDACAAAADRDPLLVVPTFPDVAAYRRELAQRGAVFGVEVVTFARLEGLLARRAGVRLRPLGRLARERAAAVATQRATLWTVADAARTRGGALALLGLADELEEARIDPARWHAAVRAWGREEPGRAAYAEDLGALYGAYRRELERLGRGDPALVAAAALDALVAEPERWGGTPVFVYGFDDLTRRQRSAVEVLATRCGAEVTVSLPYEAGRVAFSGRDSTYQELLALRPHVERLDPVPAAERSLRRPLLRHLERNLFETVPADEPPRADGRDTPDSGPPLLLLRGGGARAELELVAAHVKRLLRDGVAAGDIAIVLRRPADQAALVARVLTAAEVPFSLERRVAVAHTALGRGLGALVRCALLSGTAADLLTYLRTPGRLTRPDAADRLEEELRRDGVQDAAEARRRWEARHVPLEALDRVAAAAASGPAELCRRLAIEVQVLFAGPHRRRAPVLDGPQAADARVAGQLRSALRELAGLAEEDPALGGGRDGIAELLRVLSELEVVVGTPPSPDLVEVTSPLAVRARRVRALFCCALQEGVWPAPERRQPLLGDDERRALNRAAGLRLTAGEDRLGAERYLFYAAVSRPTDLLALSWHAAGEDGEPAVRSSFVDDVLDLVEGGADGVALQTRELGAAGWADPDLAPTARERERAAAAAAPPRQPPPIAPLRHPDVLADLAAREAFSASGLELWVACPVRWFVERLLGADELVPDPEPFVRGRLAHEVLEAALRELVAAGGGLTPEHLDEAKRLAFEALDRLKEDHRISANPERARAAVRRLEAEVVRYLDWAARCGTRFSPAYFELGFGASDDELGAVDLGDGLRLRGRIDRVDVHDGRALVYDYKGSSATPWAKWGTEGKLQLALYLLALPELTGLEAAGALYQPLGARDPRPRGAVLEGADPGLALVANDVATPEELAAALDEARRTACAAVEELRAGRLEPRPGTCAWRGDGCAHPSICRVAR